MFLYGVLVVSWTCKLEELQNVRVHYCGEYCSFFFYYNFFFPFKVNSALCAMLVVSQLCYFVCKFWLINTRPVSLSLIPSLFHSLLSVTNAIMNFFFSFIGKLNKIQQSWKQIFHEIVCTLENSDKMEAITIS